VFLLIYNSKTYIFLNYFSKLKKYNKYYNKNIVLSVKISIFNLKQQKTTKNNKNNKKQQKIQQKQQKKEREK